MSNSDFLQSFVDSLGGTAYVVDQAGLITAVGHENWSDFARKNGALDLADERTVIGRSIYDFITGAEVRKYYERVLATLTSRQEDFIAVRVNCDGPTVERNVHLSMSVLPTTGEPMSFLFQAIPISEDLRPPIDFLDEERVAEASASVEDLPQLGICSFCGRVRFPAGSDERNGTWVTGPEYYRKGGTTDVKLLHTICGTCLEQRL